jgi:hypothetical protein
MAGAPSELLRGRDVVGVRRADHRLLRLEITPRRSSNKSSLAFSPTVDAFVHRGRINGKLV